jgi:hypothetical protein
MNYTFEERFGALSIFAYANQVRLCLQGRVFFFKRGYYIPPGGFYMKLPDFTVR